MASKKQTKNTRRSDLSSTLSMSIKASLMAALTAALSFIAVPLPFSPVPVTGQTLIVMLSGSLLGSWWGSLSMLLYLAGILFGPTGGYLWGFVAGAWVTGMLVKASPRNYKTRCHCHKQDKTDIYQGKPKRFWLPYFLANVVGGIGLVHFLGVFWLAHFTGRTLTEAMFLGTVPFLVGDLFKAAAATLIGSRLQEYLSHSFLT